MSQITDCGTRKILEFHSAKLFDAIGGGLYDTSNGYQRIRFATGSDDGGIADLGLPKGARSLDGARVFFRLAGSTLQGNVRLGVEYRAIKDGDVEPTTPGGQYDVVAVDDSVAGFKRYSITPRVIGRTLTKDDDFFRLSVTRGGAGAGDTFGTYLDFLGVLLGWTVSDKTSRS